jgi:hypothetical protein
MKGGKCRMPKAKCRIEEGQRESGFIIRHLAFGIRHSATHLLEFISL